MSRVSPFCPPRRQGSSTAPAFLRCRTLRPRSDPCVAHVVIPTDYYDMSALRIPSQAAKRLVKKFSKRKEQGLVSRVSPFCPPRREGSSTAPAFLRCRTLRPRSDPCVAHVVIPTDYYDMSALRIPSQAAKRLVKKFSKRKAKKDSCHESAPFALRVAKAHQQRPPSCAVGPCDRVQIRV